MYSRNLLLLAFVVLPVFAAPVTLDDGLVKKDVLVEPRSDLSVTNTIWDLRERSAIMETAQSEAAYDTVVESKREEEDETPDSEFDTVEVLNERGITRPSGGSKRGITRPSGGSKRGITRPSGGSKRGITRPSGGSKRGITRPSGGSKRGITRPSGGSKRGITRPSGGSKRGITRPSGGSKRGITRPSGGSK